MAVIGGLLLAAVTLIGLVGVPWLPVDELVVNYGNQEEGAWRRAFGMKPEDFVGLSREDIAVRLGPPSQRNFRNWDAAYRLGQAGPYDIDSLWLVLRFDGDRVTQANVISD